MDNTHRNSLTELNSDFYRCLRKIELPHLFQLLQNLLVDSVIQELILHILDDIIHNTLVQGDLGGGGGGGGYRRGYCQSNLMPTYSYIAVGPT